ncbi:hypothetical protein [Mycolicibacterium stellerae]|uniref:hypothetical protein n=1 Tax=Mycolicibacterium stellerae TaxID=2358193 RepID=UPI000F0B39F4|nr:hypothetical protein [Mycolicibacterium stellerae]
MPNRRRRRLSTATSAVAALAVVSPFAISAISEMTEPAPQPREFRSAAMVTDLPNELMSALSQGLSQFGINLPSMPTGLAGADAAMPTTLTAPGSLASPGLTSPALTPGLTSPALTPGLTTPALGTDPAAALADPALTNPALTNPALPTPGGPAGMPGLAADAATAANPALNPALTSPTGALPGGLTTPPVTGLDSALATTPISNAAGLPAPGEVPISAPIGLDPAAGTYPILGGDPGLGLGAMPAASTGGGGIFGELSNAAQQLGAGQAIDLLKGVVMPMITSAMKPAAAAAPVPAPAPAG